MHAMTASRHATGPVEATGRRNMRLLMQLRWLAVAGQAVTILAVHLALDVHLPLRPMIGVLLALIVLNLVTKAALERHHIGNRELFLALLLDMAALSAQLYLSGGVGNPFVSLYLLQVVLGALLLQAWSSWTLVAVAATLFGLLELFAPPLDLPPPFAITLSRPYIVALWVNFLLAAVLLVLFLTRINRNLRDRDAHLAQMRQRAAEEDHIVRMGLLASGAAHELGTPLSSISVILADWKPRSPETREDVAEMQREIARCKEIVRGILVASGELVGEAPGPTTLRSFARKVAAEWDARHPSILRLDDRLGTDQPIVADRALAQVIDNVLDNALEASATAITLTAEHNDGALVLAFRDDGTGFAPDMLDQLGKPYHSSKGHHGRGLGLFLTVNVLRKLGGGVTAANAPEGGARVTLTLPLAALALEAPQ